MSAGWSLKITCKLLNTAFVNINNIYIYILHLNFFSNELGSKAIIQTYINSLIIMLERTFQTASFMITE